MESHLCQSGWGHLQQLIEDIEEESENSMICNAHGCELAILSNTELIKCESPGCTMKVSLISLLSWLLMMLIITVSLVMHGAPLPSTLATGFVMIHAKKNAGFRVGGGWKRKKI